LHNGKFKASNFTVKQLFQHFKVKRTPL